MSCLLKRGWFKLFLASLEAFVRGSVDVIF
jgi:hypothetical protein